MRKQIPFMLTLPTIVITIVLLFTGCSGKSGASSGKSSGGPDKIKVQLDWVAEPEHGGFYQAQALGYFKRAGLDVDLIQGGANGFVLQKLATGQVQFGQSDSTDTLLAIARGLPIINVAAVFQYDPSALMMHADNPVNSFKDLNGKTIMARPEWAFLPFLKKKYGINFKVIPQSFGLGQFIQKPDFIQQGYFIAEPYFIEKAGVKPKFLYTWDAGFKPYTVLVANADYVKNHPDVTRRFIKAYIQGCISYRDGDPSPAHKIMLKINPKVTPAYLKYSRDMILKEKLLTGPDGDIGNIGRITKKRFATEIKQLEDLGILAKGKVTVDKAMTTRYLPQRDD